MRTPIWITTGLLVITHLVAEAPLPQQKQSSVSIETLYATLDPYSIAKHLTFYELYPETKQGRIALDRALLLIGESKETFIKLPKLDLQTLIRLVNRKPQPNGTFLQEEQIAVIERWSKDFANRKLKGHQIETLEELLSLPPEEIDIARALFIADGGGTKEQMRSYEASLDFMALQIRAKLSHIRPQIWKVSPPQVFKEERHTFKLGKIDQLATHEEIVKKINEFIFYEMRFRFPPTLYGQNISIHTPSYPLLSTTERGCVLGSVFFT